MPTPVSVMNAPNTASTSSTTINTSPAATATATASTPDPVPPTATSSTHRPGLPSGQHPAPAADSPADSHASPDDGGAVAPKTRGPESGKALAKKRANDREAQRAIRERTKHTIENLEKKIQDLTSQQPYQELQAVLREKEAVEQELADVRNRMASIMSIIQPVLGSQQGVYASPGPSFLPNQPGPPAGIPASTGAASTPPSTASPNSAAPSWQQPTMQSAGSSTQTSPNFDQARMISQQRHNSLHALDLGSNGEQLKLNFLLEGASIPVNRMQAGDDGAQDTANYHHMPMKHDWSGFAQAAPRPNSYGQHSGPGAQIAQQQQQSSYIADQGSVPPTQGTDSWSGFSVPVRNCGPTCPLDSLLLDFLNERRQRAAEGVSAQELVGPRYPSVSSLLNPQQSQNSHPVSKVFTDILRAFPGISRLPEKVAVLYVMFLIMRWQIFPSKENYDRLPSWCVPTQSQLQILHPAWVDHLPFPEMREKIAKAFRYPPAAQVEFPFNDFFVPFTDTLSLNWPYEETDVLIETPDGELLINPVFETHMKRLENWTLGEQFAQTFPQLRGTFNLKRNTPAV
ncbi:hypothetical protein BKA67DRAFT_541075 [Truncatella angustata]|uniref:BZIP transcription factor n=1 Tax=Truncatella angustata TaxID=152316 RepID=A0A9P8UCD8_9PEZI|nr:uncharacterized protein BKA67DRAFT_541075 [Truncatella angustata]KAH6646085.1 hypothetical protein BKA67DRAFT_541075 [Truncatella angustata]